MTCSRCHRDIPENELASHMLTHKSKSRKFPTARAQKQDTLMPVAEKTSFEEFTRRILASRPQKSNLTPGQVQSIFKQILQEMNLTVNTLKVGLHRGRIQAEIVFDEQRNVELNYDDDYFCTLTEDEIRAMLSHEACHIATLPHSGVLVVAASDSVQSMQISFIELYDEFLAHKEFARRFRGSKTFDTYDKLKDGDFYNYGMILKVARTGVIDPAKALFLILNDAVYFPVIGDSRFLTWCKDNKLERVSRFLDWLVDDFRFIDSLNLDRTNTMETILQEGGLSLGVHPVTLLMHDRIMFADSAPQAEQMVSTKNKDLAERWRKRRLTGSNQN